MFVRYYLELRLPAWQVEQAMLDAPADWLSMLAGEAQRRGDHLLTEVGVGPLGPRLGRRVAIEVGHPVRFPSMISLPLTWEPVGLGGALPRLEANIELRSLGEDRTQLELKPLRDQGLPPRTSARTARATDAGWWRICVRRYSTARSHSTTSARPAQCKGVTTLTGWDPCWRTRPRHRSRAAGGSPGCSRRDRNRRAARIARR